MLTLHFAGKTGTLVQGAELKSGEYGQHACFSFSSDWEDLTKIAVFMALDGSSNASDSVILEDNTVLIPPAVLSHPLRTLYVQILGLSSDGALILISDRVKSAYIAPGQNPEALPEIDAQNPIWHDVLRQMGSLNLLTTPRRDTLVNAINSLAEIRSSDGASAYELAVQYGFEGTEAEWVASLNGAPGTDGKSAYSYALEAGFIGSEEDFAAALLNAQEILCVDLTADDDGEYHASATYMEIAHAHAQGNLVLLKYGTYITHILAGEPTESSFLFEPLLHSVPGMPGYIVNINDYWNAAPITEDSEKQVSDNFIVMLEQDDSGEYSASAGYMEIAEARGAGKLVFLRYGDFVTHILSGAPTDTSFLFEPILHSVPGIHGYIVDIQNNWSDTGTVRLVYVSDIANNLATDSSQNPLSAAQGVVLKGLYDDLSGQVGDLAREKNEVLNYGYADDATIYNAVMNGRPVYCLYEHLYHLPLVSWEEETHTAIFGGCYDTRTITCKAVVGVWSVETVDVSEPDVFVGTEDTTVAQFHEAFASGKPCFLRKANAGEGIILWVAYACSSSRAKFYRVGDGYIQHSVLNSDGTFVVTGWDHTTAITETSTDNQIPTAKAVYDAVKDIPTITQEAGQSESLVMSQKAVTDLVADALENVSKVEYETVDSVEEMTDTSKSYVLSTTGTIWAYGETAPRPAYTDLTEQTGWEWFKDKRINSSGGETDSTGSYATDYIPCAYGDTIRIKGLDITTLAPGGNAVICWYTEAKAVVGSGTATAKSLVDTGTIVYENGEYIVPACAKADGANINTAVYQRFCGKLEDGYTIDDVIITKNEEIKMTAGYGWYDTGMTPESAGNGNYVDLLVKINENSAGIAEVSARVTALESGSDTLTVPSFWQDAVDACISRIKALQVGRNCVTFPFFSDNHQRNGYAGVLIAKVMQECHIPYCFYGGDSISSGTIADEATMIAQDKAFDTIMSYVPNGRLCRAVGNHDGYWYDGTNKFYYTREQVYELFLREESVAQNKHFGDDGTYYYVDDIASKVRFIVLNTNGGSVDDAQIAWFRDTALKVDTGWAVAVISHQPISNHYHALISNAADVRAIATESGVDIIGWFSGHIHRDRIYTGAATNTEDDTEGDAMGFTQVTITSDHTGIAYDDATKHTVASDDQSHAIDFVTINRNTRTVNLTRLGIGQDRSFSY